ncbi:MAG: hypothetical protein NTY19_11305 [Planctomycetota bacterium]|nr:hypothetical protein [Planctomycetota bacterium]
MATNQRMNGSRRQGLETKPDRTRRPRSAQALEPPAFDKAGMLYRLMHDEELARIVIESFLENTPPRVKTLRRCVVAFDLEKAGDLNTVQVRLADLEALFGRLQESLQLLR